MKKDVDNQLNIDERLEKVVFYKLYTFEDKGKGKRYFYADRRSAQMARFIIYKRYDGNRISVNNYVVPVSRVREILVEEGKLEKIEIQPSFPEDSNEA